MIAPVRLMLLRFGALRTPLEKAKMYFRSTHRLVALGEENEIELVREDLTQARNGERKARNRKAPQLKIGYRRLRQRQLFGELTLGQKTHFASNHESLAHGGIKNGSCQIFH